MSKSQEILSSFLSGLKNMPNKSELMSNFNKQRDSEKSKKVSYRNGKFGGAGASERIAVNKPSIERINKELISSESQMPKGSDEFQKAFSEAKRSGLEEFEFNGKKYSTKEANKEDFPPVVKREVGSSRTKDYEGKNPDDSTFKANSDSTSFEPFVGQRLGHMSRKEEALNKILGIK